MSKYALDLDYAIPGIDISREELNAIIAEADKIITGSNENPEKLAIACLKKAQCLQKLDEYDENTGTQREVKGNIANMQELIKNLIEKALELHPNMPEALMQMGKMYHKLSITEEKNKDENMEKAIDMYCKAIQLKPDYAAAYNNRDALLAEYLDPDPGSSSASDRAFFDGFTKALNSYVADEAFKRGKSYADKRDYNHAIKEYDLAIKGYTEGVPMPDYFLAYINRGCAYVEKKEYKLALEDFKKAHDLEPNNETVINHLAKVESYLDGMEDLKEEKN